MTEPTVACSLDVAAIAKQMAAQLNACAADWRDQVMGDALFWIRRRHPGISDTDIDALVAAVKAWVEPGRRGRREVIE